MVDIELSGDSLVDTPSKLAPMFNLSKSPAPITISDKADKDILPKKHTEALMKRIKKLVSMWADEEQMNGNPIFCKFIAFHFDLKFIKSTYVIFHCRLEHYE